LFTLSGGDGANGARWGLLWGTGVQHCEAEAQHLLAAARDLPAPPPRHFAGNRATLMLDRWAGAIAGRGGERLWRSEGLLLLRLGLLGR
jgi:phytoene synthase